MNGGKWFQRKPFKKEKCDLTIIEWLRLGYNASKQKPIGIVADSTICKMTGDGGK